VTENVNRYNLQLDNIGSLQELIQELDESLNDVQLGVRQNEEIEDVAGAMFSNNSEDLVGLEYKDEDGTIDASGDLNNMTSLGQAPASGDLIAIYDSSAGDHKSITVANLGSALEDGSIFDGDHLDIDFTPSNYTPDTSPSEASDADDLAAHLKGLDSAVSGSGVSELDDLSDVSVSSPGSDDSLLYDSLNSEFRNVPIRASNIQDVSADSVSDAHHSKTSQASELSDVSPDSTSDAHHSKTSQASELSDVSADSATDAHHNQDHKSRHVDGGADELDGDLIDVTFGPSNYSPDASPAEANDVDDLAAHLKGIDANLGGSDVDGYIEPRGLVLSNNGTDADHDLDVTAGRVWVDDFSDGGQLIDVGDNTPALQIDSTGEGGRINSSGLSANTWYECAILYDSGNDTVGFGMYQDADRPTGTGDLPGTFDHFRAMGTPGKTWWVRTDGSSNIFGFKHSAGGWIAWTPSTAGTLGKWSLDDSNPNTSATSFGITVPPVTVNVNFSQMELRESGSTSNFSLSHETFSDKFNGQVYLNIAGGGGTTKLAPTIYRVTGQQIYYLADSDADRVRLSTTRAFKAIGA
jgi:hypothetical protein